jgi:RimJ/RimL family protein N-acetyltransferase
LAEGRSGASSLIHDASGTTILEASDDDFAAMLRGEAVRDTLAQPPGGVDQPHVIAYVRKLAANLRTCGYSGGHWMIVANGEVVGLCGLKEPPSAAGEVELGYGVAESRRRRGHASAAVRAVIEAVRRDFAVRAITATTEFSNLASQRVLESNGFERTGTRWDSSDGEVIVWRRPLSC